MSTLHLTLHRQWFEAIACGQKTEEYREIKPYWTKRLVGKHYDQIVFRNGYSANSPKMTVEFLGLSIGPSHENKICYVLKLGNITVH